MRVAYFVHELQDPAVLRRVRMMSAAGAEIELFGFQRREFDQAPETPTHVLGRTQNGRLAARALAMLTALPRAYGLRKQWRTADFILARNLETLLIVCVLAWIQRLQPRIIYECLDIHRMMLGHAPLNAILRAIERACLKRVALLLTSSPAFIERYFRARQSYAGEALLIENKTLALDEVTPAIACEPPQAPPWKIVWCGILRCQRSFDILLSAAEHLGPQVEIEFWGAPALDQIPDFHTRIAQAEHVAFKGRYTAQDLPRIYGGSHFAWTLDYYEAGGNSDWLLPNRLYESLAFAAVPIAAEGVETARWLRARQLGLILEGDVTEALKGFLRACTPERFQSLRAAAIALDPAATTLGRAECSALLAKLAGPDLARAA